MADSNMLAELLTAVLQNRQNNYSNAAALTLLVYDIFLTMGKEVTYIWGARWSIPKALYLFGRYYGVCYLTFVNTLSKMLSPTRFALQCVTLRWNQSKSNRAVLPCLLLVLWLRGFSLVHLHGQCDLRSSDPRFV